MCYPNFGCNPHLLFKASDVLMHILFKPLLQSFSTHFLNKKNRENKEGHIKKEEKRDVLLHLLFLNLCCNNSPLTLSLSSRTPAALARPNLRLLREISQKNEQFALVSFLYSWISIVLYLSICAMIGMLVVQTWRLLLNFPASFRFVICKCIFSFFVNSNFSHF